jgi:hypothetical protein
MTIELKAKYRFLTPLRVLFTLHENIAVIKLAYVLYQYDDT